MHQQHISIPASDAYELAASLFLPEAPARACVLINSATAVRRRYYQAYAEYLARCGFAVVTYDYRGIGDSLHGDIRQLKAVMTDWATKDYAAILGYLQANYAQLPVIVVGHSAGGWLLGIIPEHPGVVAIITVCTQSGYWGHWRGHRRVMMALLWHVVMPGVSKVLGYCPSRRLGFGEDLPAGVATQWAYWGRHAEYMIDREGRPLRAGFYALTVPIKSYSFADDPMAPRPAVENIHALFKRAPVERQHLSPAQLGVARVGHFGFFRPEQRDQLWRSSLDWISKHAGDRADVSALQPARPHAST
jgi:predicted alpha/beta hydrolase